MWRKAKRLFLHHPLQLILPLCIIVSTILYLYLGETNILNAPNLGHYEKKNNTADPDSVLLHQLKQLPQLQPIPSNLSWINVSKDEKERTPRCVGPLQHSCIGQCRGYVNKLEEGTPEYDQLFIKPEESRSVGKDGHIGIVGMKELLEYLDFFVRKHQQNKKNTSCTMFFVGDSTSGDIIHASTRSLIELGYEIKHCYGNIFQGGPNVYGEHQEKEFCERTAPPQEEGGISYDQLFFPALTFTNPSQSTCSEVILRFVWFGDKRLYLIGKSSPHNKMNNTFKGFYDDEAGVIVGSWGTHMNSREDMSDFMNTTFQKFYDVVQNDIPNHERFAFLWREHEPQHYNNTVGGTYEVNVPKDRQQCLSKPLLYYNNYRNEEVHRYFNITGLNKKIPVIPMFDAMKPLYMFKFPGDCTHYCYAPWRFYILWHGMALALHSYIMRELNNE